MLDKGDWDNLIILDACRYDVYKQVTGRDIEKRTTLGSTSHEYFARTYAGRDCSDIVYVSANGFISVSMMKEHAGETDTFYEKFETYNTGWDEKLGVTPPEPVVQDAKTAQKLFPEKRKIIHFLQPHDPFIEYGLIDLVKEEGVHRNEHDLAAKDIINNDKLEEGYKHNLRLVLGHVQDLISHLDDETVITADHGELLGRQGVYRHPSSSKAKYLRGVPWDKISS